MLIDIKVTNVVIFDTLDFSMLGVKSRKEQPDTVKIINGELLGKVSLIYGANGSGKSTFVRIMSTFRSIVLTETDTITAHEQLAKDKSLPIQFGVNFIANDTEYSYLLKFNSEVILAETLYLRKVPFKGRHVRVFERIWNGKRYDWKFGKEFTYMKNVIASKYMLRYHDIRAIIFGLSGDIAHLDDAYKWFEELVIFRQLTHRDSMESVIYFASRHNYDVSSIKFLLKSLDFAGINIKDIKYNPATNKAVVQINENTWIPIYDLSTGEKNYLALMMQVYKAKDVIIIDDFGSGLHPRLSKELLKLLHDRLGKQVIATTHDVTLIEAEIRPEQIWFVDKSRGKTEMVSLCEYTDAKRCHGRYLVGRYGGVPFIRETAFWGYNAEAS